MNNDDKQFKKTIIPISHNLKHHGKILDVYDDEVNVAGNITHWDSIIKCDAAAIIPVTESGKILMVRQYRLVVDKYTLEIPAGKLDGDEEFIVCAKRELEEETGYRSDDIEFLIDIWPAAAFCNEQVRIFVAKNLVKSKQHFDIDEETLVEEWDIDKLKEEIFKGNIKDSKTVAGIMAYIVKGGSNA